MYLDLMGRGIMCFQKYNREQGSLPYNIGNFCVGLIFAEFATFLQSPKIDTGKNKPYFTSSSCSLRVLEIAKIELHEYLKHLPNDIFTKNSRHEKFPRCSISSDCFDISDVIGRWGMAFSETL